MNGSSALLLTGAAMGGANGKGFARAIRRLVQEMGGVALASARPGVDGAEIRFASRKKAIQGDILTEARSMARGMAIDVNLLPTSGRRKSLLVADMDSTIITTECVDILADYAGAGGAVSAITKRAMRGEYPFEEALRARVALLAGLPESVLGEILRNHVRLARGARALVRTMRRHGARTALVSGGFTFFADAVGRRAGFERVFANRLQIRNGRLTGAIEGEIVTGETKRRVLMTLLRACGKGRESSMAIGDGANDAAMIGEAGLGVAFRAKPLLRKTADALLDHSDLHAALYLQGFTRAEIIQ